MEDCTVVAYGCRKTKKLICGKAGENVVAYGGLLSLDPQPPSPSRFFRINILKSEKKCSVCALLFETLNTLIKPGTSILLYNVLLYLKYHF